MLMGNWRPAKLKAEDKEINTEIVLVILTATHTHTRAREPAEMV